MSTTGPGPAKRSRSFLALFTYASPYRGRPSRLSPSVPASNSSGTRRRGFDGSEALRTALLTGAIRRTHSPADPPELDQSGARAAHCLASEPLVRWSIEELEHCDLFSRRRFKQAGALEHLDATYPAVRRSTGERDGRARVIADIEESTAALGLCAHRTAERVCRELDRGHQPRGASITAC